MTATERELAGAVDARLASLEAGNYRANTELVLGVFVDFLHDRGVTTLEELSVLDCRRYAQYLRHRVRDDGDALSAASAHRNGPYFTVVRSFLGWCVDDERLDANPARPNRVTDELPEYHAAPDRQFWTPAARDRLLDYVDARARQALDGGGDTDVEDSEGAGRVTDGDRAAEAMNTPDSEPETATDPATAFRDRALVTTLALTGVRGAEVFSDPRDDARDGLQWADVDLDRGVAVVLGKSRTREDVALPERVVTALSQHRRVDDPPSEKWPVFPTAHAPSLVRAARRGLSEAGWDTDDLESLLEEEPTRVVLSTHDIAPPAISKNGARSLMQRLCAAADVDVDGEYLKPHGGRRALGSQLYAADAELAQETLRHRSIETTHAAYRERRAETRRERIDRVLDDGRTE